MASSSASPASGTKGQGDKEVVEAAIAKVRGGRQARIAESFKGLGSLHFK